MSRSARSAETWATVLLLGALLAFHAWWATQAWSRRGLSGHEFRQAQTAVTIREMIRDGALRIDYATPILGKPWSLPMEFPTYQFVVARICRATGWELVPVARGVSLAAFYAGMAALFLMGRRLGLSRFAAGLALVPVGLAPVYLFYSRTVMIEGLAWSASAWFLWGVLRYRAERRPVSLALALLLGVVAVLTKATTWAVFCAPWAGLMAHDAWRILRDRDGRRAWRLFDEIVLLAGPVFAVGLGWVWMADRIKELNPVATFLTSYNLRIFNFGTWAQRLDPATWRAIWTHLQHAAMPGWAAGLALLAAVTASRRSRVIAGCLVLGIVAGPLVLVNLYAIHDYYFYANAGFICALSGLAAATWWDRGGRAQSWRLAAIGLLVATGAGQWRAYRGDLYQVQTSDNSGSSEFTRMLDELTQPADVLVMHSPDWSAILPWQIDRRMLIIPDHQMFFRPHAVRQEVALLRDERVTLVIFWGESRRHPEWAVERIQDFNLDPLPLFRWEEAIVYGVKDRSAEMRERLARAPDDGVHPVAPTMSAPIVPLGEPAKVAGATNMEPLPQAGSLPMGASLRWHDGVQYFFVHSPTELRFAVPAKASRVEIGYRMEAEAYRQEAFDGVAVRVELQSRGKPVRLLHVGVMTRENSRAPRHVEIPLAPGEGDTLIFQVLPGPSGSNAYDWALLEYLRIR